MRRREVYVPMENKLYQLARQLGVLEPRRPFAWTGDPYKAGESRPEEAVGPAHRRLAGCGFGDLEAAAIPGEIYPELGARQGPGSRRSRRHDSLDAPIRTRNLQADERQTPDVLIGLANDEIGYIIPETPVGCEKPCPFLLWSHEARSTVRRIASGPDTAPILCQAFKLTSSPERSDP